MQKAHAIPTSYITALLIGAAMLSLSFVPFVAQAASKTPSCTLTVTTEADRTTIKKEGEVTALEGDEVKIAWKGKNAKSAENADGDKIKVSGKETIEADETETYEYTFKNGSKEVTCAVTVEVTELDASIDESSVSKGSEKPTLKGTADGLKKVRVAVYKEGSSKPVFEKKSVTVKKGKWSTKVSKRLAKGDYEVRLYAYKGTEVLDEEDLTVGSKKSDRDDKDDDDSGSDSKSDGTLSVGMIPLGMSGTAQSGKAFSATLIEVRNTGTEEVKITGFGVRQSGTASANAIATLYTVDNKGAAAASKSASWKNGVAVAPADAVIPAGGVKLFTVKATTNGSASTGSTVVLDIVSVESNAKSTKGSLPIKGNVMRVI